MLKLYLLEGKTPIDILCSVLVHLAPAKVASEIFGFIRVDRILGLMSLV